MTTCNECKRNYGSDLNIPDWAWKIISPTNNGDGHLCPTCMCERLEAAGIRTIGRFVGGPLTENAGTTLGYIGDRVLLRQAARDDAKNCFKDPASILTIEKIERGERGVDFWLAEHGCEPAEYFSSQEVELLAPVPENN